MDLRKKKMVGTIVFPKKNGRVLLARKTRKIGVGLWNGWGGGQEEGETIRQAAIREFKDESGLSADMGDLEYVGKVTFHNQKPDGREFDVEVHMFLLRKWGGEIRPNPEMKEPTSWSIDSLPFDEMMPSDKDWLPLVLSGQWIEGDTWQKWIDQGPDKPPLVVLTRPSEIRPVDRLRGID